MADEVQGVGETVEMGERRIIQEIVKANLRGWIIKAPIGLLQKEINNN